MRVSLQTLITCLLLCAAVTTQGSLAEADQRIEKPPMNMRNSTPPQITTAQLTTVPQTTSTNPIMPASTTITDSTEGTSISSSSATTQAPTTLTTTGPTTTQTPNTTTTDGTIPTETTNTTTTDGIIPTETTNTTTTDGTIPTETTDTTTTDGTIPTETTNTTNTNNTIPTETTSSAAATQTTTLEHEEHKSNALSSGSIAVIICVFLITVIAVFVGLYFYRIRRRSYNHLLESNEHFFVNFSNPMYDS
ncbi:cell wall protein DAN4 [Trematomus bernacchii]|uniref:cell wall protein DAN4 n=1 Tax=Trematomus bernacchii TaxID=40690 RepID=UPI00146E24A8|nr:cell wall protein DAN4 [Trematomus bernacchii]